MTWLPFAIGAAIGLPIGIRRLRRTNLKISQQKAGRARCAYCNARLKAREGICASTCGKCGRTQPWSGTPLPTKTKPSRPTNAPASFSPDFHADWDQREDRAGA